MTQRISRLLSLARFPLAIAQPLLPTNRRALAMGDTSTAAKVVIGIAITFALVMSLIFCFCCCFAERDTTPGPDPRELTEEVWVLRERVQQLEREQRELNERAGNEPPSAAPPTYTP
ncbi:hypothetical protein B0H19DRAFT_1256812 [Mycena capillaripes]|nr:hypothetical protein B0H19DRAFT_1256812 [Mycena capillaripes]